MRALVFREPHRIDVVETPVPDPRPDQVLVRLRGCGVCGSNLPVWEGRPWFSYPFAPGAPGHEGWGEVADLGRDVNGLRVGQPVALLSYHAFAEYDVADPAALVPLPPSLADVGLPAEAVACAVNVLRRSRIQPRDAVAVVGVGFLGALIVQLAARAGARVTALGRRAFALDLARQGGARHVVAIEAGADGAAEAVRLNGGPFDRVIEAAGQQSTLDLASALTRERGTLVIAGYHQDGPRTIDLQSWNWRGLDVINAHERDTSVYVSGMREAVALVASGALTVAPLLTHTLPLAESTQAFRLAETRPEGFLKAVVRCDA